MVIMSFRFSKKKIAFIVGLFLFAITAVLFGGKLIGTVQQTAAHSKIKSEKILGGTEEERQKFIRSFGWEITEEPLTVMEVKIPEEFDSIYEEYNNLQKTQGMDLTKYQGKRCKKYQYSVLNYPDQPEHVICTLLVYDGRIIGGDISTSGEESFTLGFSMS